MRLIRTLCGIITGLACLALTAACSTLTASPAKTVVLDSSYYTDAYAYNATGLLGRGINMGNFLEAPGNEGAWTGGRLILTSDFTTIKAAGFNMVRIPIRWSDHALPASPYTIDATFLARVKQVVDAATAAGLKVDIDVHHYNELFAANAADLPGHKARLHAIWSQICDAFPISTYAADRLVFELLNEPNGSVTFSEWNKIIADLTTLVWTTKASSQNGRKIVLGTANWGGVPGLRDLILPTVCTATNTIITIHYYEPHRFTHQGAEWESDSAAWKGTRWLGSAADQKPLLDLFKAVTDWNSAPGRGFEIFMGEFGVYTKYAPLADQQAWTAFIAREAEKRHMSWAYWEYCAGFGAYDPYTKQWKQPLYDALIPRSVR